MRPEAANSMLKFLEEPEDNIVAILMTNNINNVLSTIISRCKVFKLSNVFNDVISVDEELENLAIDFVYSIENKWIDTLINIKDIWFSKVNFSLIHITYYKYFIIFQLSIQSTKQLNFYSFFNAFSKAFSFKLYLNPESASKAYTSRAAFLSPS